MEISLVIFLAKTRSETQSLQAVYGGHKVKTLKNPLNTPLSKAAKSHAGKAEAITQRTLNETMLSMRKKKKNLTASHTQHKAPPILTPSLP